MLGFGLLAGGGGFYTFDAMRTHPLPPGLAALALFLVLIGAGSKAGLVPLHVWLPLAHPAAPSHVSALMSGVMTKVAIYAFIRIAFDLLGPMPGGGVRRSWYWAAHRGDGRAARADGARPETRARLLAPSRISASSSWHSDSPWHSEASGFGGAAALALTAALFHAMNHTLFKSLLFFGAGAVIMATRRAQPSSGWAA